MLDKQGYFKDQITVAKNKFKDCVDTSFLPQYYKDKEYEPLVAIANAKRNWNEKIKYKLNLVARITRKPFISTRKIPAKANQKEVQMMRKLLEEE